jgi:phosphatidylserine decarboxylase
MLLLKRMKIYMIKYFNRQTGNYEVEKVAGDKYLNWTYSSPIGMTLLELFLKKKTFSRLYGKYCDSSFSSRKISDFVKNFDIDMSISKSKAEDFKSFNDFFIREVTAEGRPLAMDRNVLMSPGDGRLSAFKDIDLNQLVQIKGLTYSLKELIQDDSVAQKFEGGICLILRLCPVDYHRFHFVDDGICDETVRIKGHYYSVNPIALNKKQKLFCENKREWSLFHSDNFGEILHVEVGATCVGTIVQTYTSGVRLSKGSEKGYFKFGGSTTILFFQKNTVEIDAEIIHQTSLGYETKVNMGEKIGKKG